MSEIAETVKKVFDKVFPIPKVSIKIGKDTLENLKKLKVHHRETYDDVIRRLIER